MSRSPGRPPTWSQAARALRLALAAGAVALAAFAAPAEAQTISSAANQSFVAGAAATAISAITITDAAVPTMTVANGIRVRIPAGLNMTWDPTFTTATITGSGAAKVSTTVSYANGNLDLVINVTTNFAAGNAIVVSGLRFTNFTGASAASRLGLVNGGSGGAVVATDVRTKTIVAPTISSAANQTFVMGGAATAMSALTVTEASTASITAANDIRIRIPAALNMTWDPTVTTATITGTGSARVSTTVSYANGNLDLVLNVTTNFAAGNVIVVSGLRFTSFSATSPATSLDLVTGGAAGIVVASDNRTKSIVTSTISSAANQSFVVGAASTAMSAITVTDATPASITAANDIRIRIPAALNMTWDPAFTTATIGGAAAAKVSATVSYANGNRDLVVNVTTNFVAGDLITVSGLRFTSFSAASAATNLQLVTGGSGGIVVDADDKTKTIVIPTISSAANQTFFVGAATTTMSPVTVTDAATPSITAASDIRIRVPAALNMTWDPTVTAATIAGGAAGKVSATVSYANANLDLVINVTTDFAASDQIVVSGLKFTSFTAASPASALGLSTNGGVSVVTADDKTKAIAAPAISSAANQSFVVGGANAAMSTITITDATTPSITSTSNVRIRIPASLNMTWNTAVTTATIGGGAAAKMSSAVTYEDAGRTVVLDATASFAASDQITVSGLQFAGFTAASPAAPLELVVSGAGGGTAATDNRTKSIVAPTLTEAAAQTFVVGDPSSAMTTATVTDAAVATITAASDIRLRIPPGLNMSWNTALTTATLGGGAAGKVSSTVAYEDAGKTLVLNVTSDFAASDLLTVSGLQLTSFTAVSAATSLQLVVSGAGGGTAATSDKTRQVVAPTISSAANQTFGVADPATAMSAVTVTDASTATITAANDIRLRIPAGFNMVWNTALTTATLGGAAAGKVSPTVSYENAGRTLVLDVTTSFAAGDQLTISGLQFTSFTASSPAANLELVIGGTGGPIVGTDARSKLIVAGTISSAASQTFVTGQAATAMSAITVTDASMATITAANDIRLRIPAGLNMTWNTALTTATLGGAAAGKVSPTVAYEDGGRTLVLNVTSDFAANDQLTVAGLQFDGFGAASAADNLELVVGGSSGGVVGLDNTTKQVAAPAVSSAANQTFVAGQAAAPMSAVTVTDASTATITAASDIRLRIPAGFNMVWNTALTTATLAGGAAGKVSPTVAYEDAGKTLVLNVTSDFAANDLLTVSGLQFTSFAALSPSASLQLVVTGSAGGPSALDDKSVAISAAGVTIVPHSATVNNLPSNGTPYVATGTMTNTGSQADSYDILASGRPGTAITVVSISGAGVTQGANPDSARMTNLAPNVAASVTLTYSVGNVPAGTIDTLVVIVRSLSLGSVRDSVKLAIVVGGPSLTFAKTVSPSGAPLPGTDLTFTATVANVGTRSAFNVVLMDSLPADLQFKLGSVVTSLPAGIGAAVEFSNDSGASWLYTPTSGSCGAPAGYDGCVHGIRWRLLASLSSVAPNNAGSVQFMTRIP
jgi:uncharacterized repeat protein (TIGR01451 family)